MADTALELTDGGRFAYREVVLTVPRQSGKSALLCALMVWRALAFGKHQRVAYTAQTGKDATEKLLDEFAPIILDSPIANTVERVYKKAGAPSVVFRNGSRIIALPSSETAGHGQTLSGGAFLDEAMADYDERREQGLLPAMSTSRTAQLWVVSTAGDESSAYFARKVATGREAAVATEPTPIAFFEWSAVDDDADADDPEVWRSCMPALGTLTDEVAIRHARQTMTDGQFRRAYLNRFSRQEERVIPPSAWDAVQGDARPDGRIVFAVDVTLDRSAASIVAADERGHLEVVDNRPNVDWLPDRIAELVARHDAPVALDAYGPAGMLADTLEERRIVPIRYTTRDTCFAANLFYDDIAAGRMTVRPSDVLTAAIAVAEKKPMGHSWLWARMNPRADLSPLHAATIAYHAAKHRNAPKPRPVIL